MITDAVNGGASQARPWLVFTAGAMGAGKGHVVKWMSKQGYFQLPSIVQIDPDVFRTRLPEWAGYIRCCARSAGALTHKESGYCVEVCIPSPPTLASTPLSASPSLGASTRHTRREQIGLLLAMCFPRAMRVRCLLAHASPPSCTLHHGCTADSAGGLSS